MTSARPGTTDPLDFFGAIAILVGLLLLVAWLYLPEKEAIRLGLPCPRACVEEAIDGLRTDMLSLGLIWDEPQPDRDRKRRIRTNWSLTEDVITRPGDYDTLF